MTENRKNSSEAPQITVLGSGAWGTALACLLAGKHNYSHQAENRHWLEAEAKNHHQIILYCRRADQAGAINATRQNPDYLPNIILPSNLWATADAGVALAHAEIVLSAFPVQFMRRALREIESFMPPQAVLVLCSKGIEHGSEKFVSQIARDIFPENPIAILSGPSFAADVARGLPTAVTVSAETEKLAGRLAKYLSSAVFRCYASTDIIGVELGGALKNVLALAAGMAEGCGLGASARAALVTRGFAELRRVATAFGGKAETMLGLAVLGDLILTCSSKQSRNYAYGMALGKGEDITDSLLAEGVATAPVAAAMCEKKGLEAPIISAVAAILAGKINLEEAVRQFLARPLKFED